MTAGSPRVQVEPAQQSSPGRSKRRSFVTGERNTSAAGPRSRSPSAPRSPSTPPPSGGARPAERCRLHLRLNDPPAPQNRRSASRSSLDARTSTAWFISAFWSKRERAIDVHDPSPARRSGSTGVAFARTPMAAPPSICVWNTPGATEQSSAGEPFEQQPASRASDLLLRKAAS